MQDKNTNGNEENNNNLSQISKSTLVRSKKVATVDWDTRNSARLLQQNIGTKEDNRSIEIETNKGKKAKKAFRENVEEEKNKDNNDYDNHNYDNYDNQNDDNNNEQNDGDDTSNDSEAEELRSGFSNGSMCLQNRIMHSKNCVDENMIKQITVHKPLYEEELLKHGRNDSVAINAQLIKGVLPDLFAVLKFLESNDDLAYNGIICCYFFKKLQIAESKCYEWWKRNIVAV